MMKNYKLKTHIAFAVMCCMMVFGAAAQQVSTYGFSQATGTYTPLSGGTVIATQTAASSGAAGLDDVNYRIAIPFSFTYNGTAYDSCTINTNGYMGFGSGAVASTTAPISSSDPVAGYVAGVGRDLNGGWSTGGTRSSGSNVLTSVANTAGVVVGTVISGTGIPAGTTVTAVTANTITMSANATSNGTGGTYTDWVGQISTQLSGTPGSQVFTIEWRGFRPYAATTQQVNFQIQLYEGTNLIKVVFGGCTGGSGTTAQSGLRGAANTDFNDRTTTTSWASTTAGASNAATLSYTATVVPASGLTYIWTPSTPCTGTPVAGTISGPSSGICAGTGATLSITGAPVVSGVTYQWASSTTMGGPYTNMGTAATQATGNLSATTYYVVTTTCTSSGLSATTPEYTLTVNPLPTVSVTPATATVCQPGGPAATLTASGSTATYTWLPTAGLTPTTGAVVSANPTVNRTYTVTATTSAGCTATATAAVSLASSPVISSVTASPANVCSGGNSQLMVNTSSAPNYSLSTITPNIITPSGATAISSWTGGGDDGFAGPIVMPFSFKYYGNNYSQLYVGTNGYISFNDLTPESGTALRTAQTFPSTSTPNNVIALCMADLNQVSPGVTSTFVSGTAPNRVFVIDFSAVPFYSASGGVTGQIQLYETSNVVEIHVSSIAHGGSTSNNSLGIENSGGTQGSTPAGRGASTLWDVSTPEAYRWTPVPYNYAWTPATYLDNTTIVNPMASGIAATTTYTTTVTDPNNSCSASSTVTVTAGSPLTSAASVTPNDTVCAGTTVTFGATPSGGGGPYTYAWSGPNSFASTLQNPTLAATAAASGTYTVTVTDNCTAVSTATVTLLVNPAPPLAVTPSTATYCSGSAALALTASGAASYTWLPTAGLSASTGANVNATPSAGTTYTVTGTGANGCTATATAAIAVYDTPTGVTATATPPSICTGGSSQLLAATTSAPNYTLSSITPAIITPSGATAISSWTGGGDDGFAGPIAMPFSFNYYGNSYNQLYVGTNGYISFNDLTPESGASLRAAQTFPSTSTPNNVIALCMADLNQAGAAVTSTFVSGTAPNRVFVIDFSAVPFYSASGGVTGQIQLYETSNIVEVHVTSIAHGGSTSNNSLGIENATGTLGSTPAGRGASTLWDVSTPEAYRWTPGSYVYSWAPATFLDNTAIINPMASSVTSTTTYTVTVSNNVCAATGTVTLTAGSPLTSTAAVTPNDTVCAGTNLSFTSTPVGGGAPYTYAWAGPNSFTSTVQNPVITAATPAATGTYTVTITDNCSAVSTSTIAVVVNALPAVAVTPVTGLYCSPGTGVALTASNASTYTWLPSAGLSASTGTSVTATPAATTTYTVTGTDGNGCMASATTTITSAPAVTGATATSSPSAICAGSTTTLGATGNPYTITILTENFNGTAAGWTTINNSTGGTPANSAWTLRPNGYSPGGFWTAALNSNDNSQFFLTNSDSQGSGSTTSTILQSPSINTVGLASLTLKFYNYFRYNASPDSAVVEASTNGTSWTIVNSAVATVGSPTTFSQTTVNLNSYVGNASLYVRFRYFGNWGYGWAIDNVLVTGGASSYTYNWASAPAGFTSTMQNPTDAPAATTDYTVTLSNIYGCTATATTNVVVNPVPAAPTASGAVICSGNTATITASGTGTIGWYDATTAGTHVGSGPSFTTPSLTDTTTYYVQDSSAAGCTSPRTAVDVNVNPLPVVMASNDTTVCAGSMISLSGSGASTYAWDNGVTDGVAFAAASTMTYHVTGTDMNGCMNTDSTLVTVNALPVVTASNDTALCAGGTVTLSGSGSAGTYTWDNSVMDGVAFTPASTMMYHVTGTDTNGCMNMDSTLVTVNAIPAVTASADMSAVCAGSNVTLTGGGASTYTWDNSVTDGVAFAPSSTMTYHVTGTDANGCMNTDSVTVTVNALPGVSFTVSPGMICDNIPAFALNGGSPAGGVYSGTGVSGGMFDPAVSGDGTFVLTYMVTDTNTCSNTDTAMIVVSNCTGITGNQASTIQDIAVYPNPASEMVTIAINNAGFTQLLINIVDIQGKQVYNELDKNVSAAYKKEINIEGFAKGVYYIRLTTGTDTRIQKLVIQ